jgi:hypothetical protein
MLESIGQFFEMINNVLSLKIAHQIEKIIFSSRRYKKLKYLLIRVKRAIEAEMIEAAQNGNKKKGFFSCDMGLIVTAIIHDFPYIVIDVFGVVVLYLITRLIIKKG